MEVVEYEPDRAIGAVIHDGPVEIRGRATFEAESEDRTILTISADIPGMDESADTSLHQPDGAKREKHQGACRGGGVGPAELRLEFLPGSKQTRLDLARYGVSDGGRRSRSGECQAPLA
jgi:hypothetical protein